MRQRVEASGLTYDTATHSDGVTPLVLAAGVGCGAAVRALLGAAPSLSCPDVSQAALVAEENNFSEIAVELRRVEGELLGKMKDTACAIPMPTSPSAVSSSAPSTDDLDDWGWINARPKRRRLTY
eukprot:Hpha_TRINITY_DN2862_c0_g1::TRINITY_DN2862_c0_g1_i2::g.171341::m.171341